MITSGGLFRVNSGYDGLHIAAVSVEILKTDNYPLFGGAAKAAPSVVDERVLLEFQEGSARIDIESPMCDFLSHIAFDEMVTVSHNRRFQTLGNKEILSVVELDG